MFCHILNATFSIEDEGWPMVIPSKLGMIMHLTANATGLGIASSISQKLRSRPSRIGAIVNHLVPLTPRRGIHAEIFVRVGKPSRVPKVS